MASASEELQNQSSAGAIAEVDLASWEPGSTHVVVAAVEVGIAGAGK
jgi:hypothetical protein